MLANSQTPSSNQANATPGKAGFRFTLKQLLFAIAVVSVVLAIWIGFVHKVVNVRPASSDDIVREHYFGIDEERTEIRNIVVAKGTFTNSTWLSASLFAVQRGQIQEVNAFTVGRSPNQIGSPIWKTMTITLALGSSVETNRRIVQLGSCGHSRGGGRGGYLPVSMNAEFTDSFTGSITPGHEYIIYVEGDTEFEMCREMTLDQFAAKNDYLVVTAELH